MEVPDLPPILRPGLQAVLVGTRGQSGSPHQLHYYDGRGNHFWTILHDSGLVPERLEPTDDERLPEFGFGLTDLVYRGGVPDLDGLHRQLRRARPDVVAFVSKSAAAAYASVTRQRQPGGYGPLSWSVVGRPAFVLPGSSGANNAMSLPLRVALWRDLADFIETL
jgi:TDG/mug DNA glycosylase family protein